MGKTTTAAAVAALAARRGRRTLVCTIDPAPRLADALGTGGLGPEPRPCRPRRCRALGIDGAGGQLPAVRIDTEATFERLVNDSVADPEMRRRIFDNIIYRQITTMLTGSQEYAATLALHDFVDQRAIRSGRARHAADGERARLSGRAPRGSRPLCPARR